MANSIGKRILLGFGAVVIVLVALGVYALGQIGAVRDTTDAIVGRDIAMARLLDDLANKSRELGTYRRDAVIAYLGKSGQATRPEDVLPSWIRTANEIEGLLADLTRSAESYRTSSKAPERAAIWKQLLDAGTESTGLFRELRPRAEGLFALIAGNDMAGVEARSTELNGRQAAFIKSVANVRNVLDQSVSAGQRSISDLYDRSRLSIGLTLAACVILALFVTYLISRAVVHPLESVMAFAERVGGGDLTGKLEVKGGDEIDRLGRALNDMVSRLTDLARTSRAATADMTAAAAEIRASAQQQAASVEEQFAAVQETAATVDEITHSGAQIGARAAEVIATAQNTAQTSRSGLRAMADTAKAMDAIREQAEAVAGNIVSLSEKTQTIGEIITTVNDISERTHLLALNAAIEAAAAGESGRSFAVVASEMKLLADQAKGATAQVRTILSEIQRGINTSVMLTEEAVKRTTVGKSRIDTAQRTIEETSARAEESVHTFQQIVASTNQQQLGIEQVMGALQNIRQASQQTAAGTREVETASANLTELAQALTALSERYQY